MSAAIQELRIPPVVKTITVPCSAEKAFRLFTAEVGQWWPLKTHSLAKEPRECAFEERLGGRVFERDASGQEHEWGRVTIWDPPRRLAFTWLVRLTEAQAQSIDVTFDPEGSGTRVRLTHSGWEKLGEEGRARREMYDQGWVHVLERCFGEHVAKAA